jgi:hypothetical protein
MLSFKTERACPSEQAPQVPTSFELLVGSVHLVTSSTKRSDQSIETRSIHRHVIDENLWAHGIPPRDRQIWWVTLELGWAPETFLGHHALLSVRPGLGVLRMRQGEGRQSVRALWSFQKPSLPALSLTIMDGVFSPASSFSPSFSLDPTKGMPRGTCRWRTGKSSALSFKPERYRFARPPPGLNHKRAYWAGTFSASLFQEVYTRSKPNMLPSEGLVVVSFVG